MILEWLDLARTVQHAIVYRNPDYDIRLSFDNVANPNNSRQVQPLGGLVASVHRFSGIPAHTSHDVARRDVG